MVNDSWFSDPVEWAEFLAYNGYPADTPFAPAERVKTMSEMYQEPALHHWARYGNLGEWENPPPNPACRYNDPEVWAAFLAEEGLSSNRRPPPREHLEILSQKFLKDALRAYATKGKLFAEATDAEALAHGFRSASWWEHQFD